MSLLVSAAEPDIDAPSVNVSVCFYPIEILPTIFRYGYATPFYNINTAVRAIVFDTQNKRTCCFLSSLFVVY